MLTIRHTELHDLIEKVDEIRSAFFSGRCDVYTTDASSLAATRAANVPPPQTIDDYVMNRKLLRVQCDPTNLGPVTVNGNDSYGVGYFGPGSGAPLVSITGTTGDKVTVMVEA